MAQEHPPAWHPDPTGLHDHRWWDGSRWTEHVADAGVASIDPLPAAPAPQQATTEPAPQQATTEPEPQQATTEPEPQREPEPEPEPEAAPGPAAASRSDATIETVPEPTIETGPEPEAAIVAQPAVRDPRSQPAAPWDPASPAEPEMASSSLPLSPDPDRPVAATSGPATTHEQGPGREDERTAGPRGYLPSGFAAASLVLAATAIPLSPLIPWYVPVGGILGFLAVVLAIVGLRRARRGTGGGRGIALAGLLVGILAMGLSAFFFWYYADLRSSVDECVAEGRSETECQDELIRDLTDRFLPGR